MTGSLLPAVIFRAADANGKPLPGALLYSYLTTTLSPAPTYTTSALSVPSSNPVVADSSGTFPEIFLDPAVTYRFQLKTAGGVLLAGGDIDPFTVGQQLADASVTAAKLAAGAAASNLGYVAVNKAGDTMTGELIVGSALSVPPNVQSVGFRGMPPITRNAIYTFAAEDSGRLQRHTDGSAYAWTIPPNSSVPFPIGTIIPWRNFGSGVITLTRGAAVALTISGSGTSKDIAVAQYGFGSLVKEDTDVWLASGTGMS